MEELISQLGLSITANALWDYLKTLGTLSNTSFKEKLAKFIGIQNDEQKMEWIINFLIKNNCIKQDQYNKISILLEDIVAAGDVTGFEGNTSNEQVKDIFENKPMDITLRRVTSEGKVTGMKLNVDDRAELKQPLSVKANFDSVQFDPGDGRTIIFGGNAEDAQ